MQWCAGIRFYWLMRTNCDCAHHFSISCSVMCLLGWNLPWWGIYNTKIRQVPQIRAYPPPPPRSGWFICQYTIGGVSFGEFSYHELLGQSGQMMTLHILNTDLSCYITQAQKIQFHFFLIPSGSYPQFYNKFTSNLTCLKLLSSLPNQFFFWHSLLYF